MSIMRSGFPLPLGEGQGEGLAVAAPFDIVFRLDPTFTTTELHCSGSARSLTPALSQKERESIKAMARRVPSIRA